MRNLLAIMSAANIIMIHLHYILHVYEHTVIIKRLLNKVDALHNSSPLCLLCNIQVHDITHIFSCTYGSTQMTFTLLDLQTSPAHVAPL